MLIPALTLPNPVKIGSGHAAQSLSGNLVLGSSDAQFQRIDPNGSARDVTLPAEEASEGLFFWILNTANAAENLVVKNDAASTVVTISQNEAAVVVCDGSSWEHMGIITIAQS